MGSATRFSPRLRSACWYRGVIAMYVLAVALLPLAHHDVVCHAKSSTHCTTCVVAASAEQPSDGRAAVRAALDDLGATGTGDASLMASPGGRLPPGRAPPLCA